MVKWRAVLTLLAAMAPLVPAHAQFGSGLSAPSGGAGFTSDVPGYDDDDCKPVPQYWTRLPLSTAPPREWQGRHVDMYATIIKDGSPTDVKLVRSSGSASLDAAALAQVQKAWRWYALPCSSRGQGFSIRIPVLGCVPQPLPGSTPLPPMNRRYRGEFAVLDLTAEPDGKVSAAGVSRSSGVASRDAFMKTQVQKTWRYYPLAAGCPAAHVQPRIAFPNIVSVCEPSPMPETQTSPDVTWQEAPRSVDLAITVRFDGAVVGAEVKHSSGDAVLDAAAIAHVKQAWRWEPFSCADLHGQGIATINGDATVHFP